MISYEAGPPLLKRLSSAPAADLFVLHKQLTSANTSPDNLQAGGPYGYRTTRMAIIRGPWDKEVVSAEVADQGPAVLAARSTFFERLQKEPSSLAALWTAVRETVPIINVQFLNRTFWEFLHSAKVHHDFELAWEENLDVADWHAIDEQQLARLAEVWPPDATSVPPGGVALRFAGYLEQRGWDLKVEMHLRLQLRREFAGRRLGLSELLNLALGILSTEERPGEARAVTLSCLRRWTRGALKSTRGRTPIVEAVPCDWLRVAGPTRNNEPSWTALTADFVRDLGHSWQQTAKLDPARELAWFLPSPEVPDLDPARSDSA